MDLGGAIRLLNLRGRRIESDLDYDLQQSDEPFGDFGEADLMGMFVYFADASIFDPCYTGSRIPVAMVERHIDLEHAYMKNRSAPAAPLLVRIIARIENRPAMEGEGQEESLVVTAVRDVSPGESCARIYTLRHEAGWHLAELDGLPIASRDHAPPPELAFHGSDLSGFTGCNRLTASFIATEDSLRLGPIVTTRRACPDSTESRFLELLKTVDAYEIIDDKLILESDDMSVAVLHASQDPKSE
jgi:heat shock protein HslJ